MPSPLFAVSGTRRLCGHARHAPWFAILVLRWKQTEQSGTTFAPLFANSSCVVEVALLLRTLLIAVWKSVSWQSIMDENFRL